jgi:hypothetical protein
MPETMQTVGKQITFSELVREFQLIQIPIIQRDYAQGRSGLEELRHEFLLALKQALDKEGDSPSPLDLDFVYGSGLHANDSDAHEGFAPLDGQQRLTALFLLHWYLAWKDGEASDFQKRFVADGKSRFSYEVRPSSHDFFNRLALNFPEEAAPEVRSLRSLIEDKSWFFQSWNHDPTIASALTVLDTIHGMFSLCEGYYRRLINPDHPRITFQLLELKDFGLSDDLYIKMNARGKPLTAFETFKARLEQHLNELLPNESRDFHGKKVSVKDYFSHRMDTAWADLFWAYRNPVSNLYDGKLMRLIRAVALVSLDPTDSRADRTVSELRSLNGNVSYSRFFDLGCLNKRMLKTLEAVLDFWCADSRHRGPARATTIYDGWSAFDSATSDGITLPELVKFAAFCSFVINHELPLNLECCDQWLRVTSNLVDNSDVERSTEFIAALESIHNLEPHADRILEYLSEGSEVRGFNRQQVREERVKATLMLHDGSWKERIIAAEQHDYFTGQIEFLLKFSGILDHWLKNQSITWSINDNRQMQEAFSSYLAKATAVFDRSGLRHIGEHKWERALLAVGDYTLTYGKNCSLLQNRTSSGGRHPTWKLLLRGDMASTSHEEKRLLIKTLLDNIDLEKGIEPSLGTVLSNSRIDEPWRRMLVESPQMMSYCGQKMLRLLTDGSVYLLSKVRTSADHVELWSYYLYHTVLTKLHDCGELSPLICNYLPTNSDYNDPFIELYWTEGPTKIRIQFKSGKYLIAFDQADSDPRRYLINKLEQSYRLTRDDESIALEIATTDAERMIREIVGIAREYSGRSQDPPDSGNQPAWASSPNA